MKTDFIMALYFEYQALSQLTNYLGHFPFNTGAVRPHSQVTENEDGSSLEDDLTPAIFDKDNVQVSNFLAFDFTSI